MCLIHDLGEAFTGDIPTSEKTESDEEKAATQRLKEWVRQLPEAICRGKMQALYQEMEERQTLKPEFIRHWTIWRH